MAESGRRIVVAGVASAWGTALAEVLARDARVAEVIGIDTERPRVDLPGVEFLEADIRSPLLARILPTTEADTVVHCGILWYPEEGKPERALHDINVIGTLQLLAACEKTRQVERVIVRGSAAIYGCEPAAPSFFGEQMARSFPLRTRFQRDIGELESYFENFARRHPDLTCCMLRFQPELGVGMDLPLARYLSLPVVPTQLGYDPRLQLIHADDALAALHHAALDPVRGAVNVAPDGSISLSRALRLIGRNALPVPHPVFPRVVAGAAGALGVGPLRDDAVRLLRFGRGVDNTRLKRDLRFIPKFDAVGSIRDFGRRSSALGLVPIPSPGGVLGRLAGRS